jgi:hypothetical protein
MAMTREQLSELMSAYLDGEVNPQEKAVVEASLRADPAARRLLDELRQTAALAALPRRPPPQSGSGPGCSIGAFSYFRLPTMKRCASEVTWHPRAAAILAVVVGAGWWFLSSQQEQRSRKLAGVPAREVKELGSDSAAISPETSKAGSLSIEAESLIASGADPVVLVKQSFEPEPIRLRVIARNEAERDALSRQFTTQLAEANTENLAHREASSEKKHPVGAFYLEGKPGINFANAQEKQILARLPQAERSGLSMILWPMGKLTPISSHCSWSRSSADLKMPAEFCNDRKGQRSHTSLDCDSMSDAKNRSPLRDYKNPG